MENPLDNQRLTTKLLQLDYQVCIKKLNTLFVGEIRELAIKEESEDINQLWILIEDRKKTIINRFIEAGIEDEIPLPLSRDTLKRSAQTFKGLNSFLFICLIFLALFSYFMINLSISIKSKIDHGINKLEILRSAGLVNICTRKLINVSSTLEKMPDSEKEKIHVALRSLNNQLLPFAKDIKPLIDCVLQYDHSSDPTTPLKIIDDKK